MANRLLITITVLIFLIIVLTIVFKKDVLKKVYSFFEDYIPGYAKKILYVVVIILILFLIVFEILQYQNINIFKA